MLRDDGDLISIDRRRDWSNTDTVVNENENTDNVVIDFVFRKYTKTYDVRMQH